MNLENLQPPQVIEELSFEEILASMINDLIARAPEFTAYLESDPLIKLMEVAAYRELLLRQRINQAAKANLLAFATGSDLENLGILYGIERKPGESDDDLRNRIRLKIVGWSSSGSREAYRFHAINADTRVHDARADSPIPGLVRISILSKKNGGVVSEDLLNAVKAHIMRDDIRMLTDTVEIIACRIVPVDVVARLKLMSATPTEILETIKNDFRRKFAEVAQMGERISTAWIIANLFSSGVQDVELISPTEDVFINETECAALNALELRTT